ncbi:MAG: ArsI/CadI family heavy metal resistance metalloenzyme [Gammaproteobacteria bacterium]
MKRLHIHVAVADLTQSVNFYSTLFGSGPNVQKPDYAKWSLDDPHVNFAISTRSATPGLDHLGIQVDEAAELDAITERLHAAGSQTLQQEATTCCYARSDKTWVEDPAGLRWESFRSLGETVDYGVSGVKTDADHDAATASACCAPTLAPVASTDAGSGCGSSKSTCC